MKLYILTLQIDLKNFVFTTLVVTSASLCIITYVSLPKTLLQLSLEGFFL